MLVKEAIADDLLHLEDAEEVHQNDPITSIADEKIKKAVLVVCEEERKDGETPKPPIGIVTAFDLL